jgi:hypothetical protein
MKTASDHRDKGCQAQDPAKSALGARMRDVIVRMAETWDDLAAEHERQVLEQEAGSLG